jgi:hypothetical protein
MRALRTTLAALAAAAIAGAIAWGTMAASGGKAGQSGQGATDRAALATTQPAADKPPAGWEPLPLKLPHPKLIGTPKSFTGARLSKCTPSLWLPRPPFYAPKGTANLALNRPVTASDSDPVVGELKQITDGNKEAGEGNFVELGPNLQYVQIDLGRPSILYAMLIWHDHQYFTVYHDVVVQVADDKDFITNVRTLFSNDHDNSSGLGIGQDWAEYLETFNGLLVPAEGILARYVRLYSNGSTDSDLNRYTEVEVWGQP